MELRGSVRLPMVMAALVAVTLAVIFFPGESEADFWRGERSSVCTDTVTACGEVCIYADCAHCPLGKSSGINCHPCVPGEDTGET